MNPDLRSKALLGGLLLLAALCVLLPSTSEAAIAFRSAASRDQNDQATSLTITKPAGTTNGDVLIAVISARPNTVTITAPTGFALINRQNNTGGSANAVAMYWKLAASGEPANYTWTISANTGNAGGIMAFSGVDNANPINASAGALTAASTTIFSAPSVTTSVTNTMIVTAHEYASSSRWTAPTGMTEAVDVASLAVTDQLGISVLGSYKTQAAAGATGALTATATAASRTRARESPRP